MQENKKVDKFGLWNIIDIGNDFMPTCNDGWIFSAFAVKLGVDCNFNQNKRRFGFCEIKKFKTMPMERFPGKTVPPLSRDVVIGMEALGVYRFNNWSFSPSTLPVFSLFKLIYQASLCVESFFPFKLKHRNYFWMNNLTQMYRLAFSVPFVDREFILRARGEKVPFIYKAISFIDKSIGPSSVSSRFISWLKYDTEISVKDFIEVFGQSHPFTEAARNLSCYKSSNVKA